jgi:two-component system response regulator NreC
MIGTGRAETAAAVFGRQSRDRSDAQLASDTGRDGAGATVVLADDHPVVRRGLRMLLEEAGFEIAAEAEDAAAALRKVVAYKPDVLVLDLSMPGASSLQAIPTLVEKSPGTAIVIVTMHDETSFARVALRSGASAFVIKEAADSELVEAVRAAVGGNVYLSARLGARIAAEPESAPLDGLTDREVEVLKLLALGYTSKEIGRRLSLASRTIESHRAHIQRKLGRLSLAELFAYARKRQLITASPPANSRSSSWPTVQR